jgi:hypothetical protein
LREKVLVIFPRTNLEFNPLRNKRWWIGQGEYKWKWGQRIQEDEKTPVISGVRVR